MGSATGVRKTAAARIGVTPEAYGEKVQAGLKWCFACKEWQALNAFGSDASRTDGKAATCIASRSTGRPKGWHGRPSINPITGRPGPVPNWLKRQLQCVDGQPSNQTRKEP